VCYTGIALLTRAIEEELFMAYDLPMFQEMIQPMREELTQIGFEEIRTAEGIDRLFSEKQGVVMLVVNSICGCAAGIARPAIAEALRRGPRPDRLATVFAGQDVDATKRAREYFTGFAPSSPSIAFIKNGQFMNLIERRDIEGHTLEDVAAQVERNLVKYCQ
jgi:putative YphP/YqiW family bacilliredoxin